MGGTVAERAEVVFVDGVRTPFGRAGEKGMFWNTRADDLVVKAMIGLLERNPQIPGDRYDDVAIAATTQTGDQGLTLGRTAALLAGLPKSVPGYAIDRMCAGAMTSVTTIAASLETLGARPWQIDATAQSIAEAFVEAAQTPAESPEIPS